MRFTFVGDDDDIKRDAHPANRAPPIGDRPTHAELVLINAATVIPKPINWMWPNWLQRGVLNLICGRSTNGKSTIALSYCAIATSGLAWPDGTPFGKPEPCIYWSGEDGVDDTLVPRFMAASGNRESCTLHGSSEKIGKGGAWVWELPSKADNVIPFPVAKEGDEDLPF
jgi:hypothetical protein